MFAARHVTPVAYAAFAVVLGTVVGMLVRRTLPAMALTLARLRRGPVRHAEPGPPVPDAADHHLETDDREAINELRSLGGLADRPTIGGLTVPDAWVTDTSELLTADGQPLDVAQFNTCIGPDASDDSQGEDGGRFGAAAQCLADLDLHVTASYQPNHRYWPFQWLESAIYLLLSALLAVLGRWRIQRRLT